jgi:hypothetical protein
MLLSELNFYQNVLIILTISISEISKKTTKKHKNFAVIFKSNIESPPKCIFFATKAPRHQVALRINH